MSKQRSFKQKPKVLSDVKPPNLRLFVSLPKRLNFSRKKSPILRLSKYFKAVSLVVVISYLVFGSVLAPVSNNQLFAAQNNEEREELERQLSELESQMSEYEATIADYKKKGNSLQSEIDRMNAKIRKINLQIKSVNLSIKKLDKEISENEGQVGSIEGTINLNKSALIKAIRKVNENENSSLVMILLQHATISEFFGDINNWFDVQDSLSATLTRIKKLRIDLLDEREALAIKRSDAAALHKYQSAQRFSIADIKKEKSGLLKITKGRESKYLALLKATEKTAAQIRSQIFQLIGGGELNFEKAYELARFASQATGIRPAMILAVLDRESSLGQNVGSCNYKTAMHPRRDIPVFRVITENLLATGNAPPNFKVSCANSHGAYGGAMGPAQFIPSTWAIYGGYRKDSDGGWNYVSGKDWIKKVSGNRLISSPWNNADAFIATALYLEDLYKTPSCREYATVNSKKYNLSEQMLNERCAAAKYYAGRRWWTYRFWYGDAVVERANELEKDIAILNG